MVVFGLPIRALLGQEVPSPRVEAQSFSPNGKSGGTEMAERLHIVGVGAHPDDVGIGAGGVIASYVKRGHRATILNVTLGETVRPPGPQQEEAKSIRRKEGKDIARKLGADAMFLGHPANTII